MVKCIIDMYGIPPGLTDLRSVEVEINEHAGLADLVAALREKVPSLEGYAIEFGQNKLMEDYAFNIDGCFYTEYQEFNVREGEHISFLALIYGG